MTSESWDEDGMTLVWWDDVDVTSDRRWDGTGRGRRVVTLERWDDIGMNVLMMERH